MIEKWFVFLILITIIFSGCIDSTEKAVTEQISVSTINGSNESLVEIKDTDLNATVNNTVIGYIKEITEEVKTNRSIEKAVTNYVDNLINATTNNWSSNESVVEVKDTKTIVNITPISPPNESSIAYVDIFSSKFNPSELRIVSGTTVRWRNKDSARHSINSDFFNSIPFDKGEYRDYTFTSSGIYDYYCAIHNSNSVGRVIVD